MTQEQLSKLNPEEKRVKIAEASGFLPSKEDRFPHRDIWTHPKSIGCYWTMDDLPDYLRSLDAMHEAEKTITNSGDQWLEYTNAVTDSTGVDYEIHATAAQRADAFLLAL